MKRSALDLFRFPALTLAVPIPASASRSPGVRMLPRGALSPSQLPRSMALSSLPTNAAPVQTERCFVVELAGSELVYFTWSPSGAPGGTGRPPGFLPRPGRCYSFCIDAAQSLGERVRAARLHQQLRQRLSRAPFGAVCRALPLLSYSPAGAAAPEKGFLVQVAEAAPETERSLEELLCLHLPAPAHLCVYQEAEDGQVWCALWRLKGAAQSKELLGRARVLLLASPPDRHPAAAHLLDGAVFRSREASRRVLQEVSELPAPDSQGPEEKTP